MSERAKREQFEVGQLTQYKLQDLNRFRDMHGLSPIKAKQRECLRCNDAFMSMGPNNRLCSLCGGRDEFSFNNLPSVNRISTEAPTKE